MEIELVPKTYGYAFERKRGEVPEELKGIWNSRRLALEALETVRSKIKNSPKVKKAGEK